MSIRIKKNEQINLESDVYLTINPKGEVVNLAFSDQGDDGFYRYIQDRVKNVSQVHHTFSDCWMMHFNAKEGGITFPDPREKKDNSDYLDRLLPYVYDKGMKPKGVISLVDALLCQKGHTNQLFNEYIRMGSLHKDYDAAIRSAYSFPIHGRVAIPLPVDPKPYKDREHLETYTAIETDRGTTLFSHTPQGRKSLYDYLHYQTCRYLTADNNLTYLNVRKVPAALILPADREKADRFDFDKVVETEKGLYTYTLPQECAVSSDYTRCGIVDKHFTMGASQAEYELYSKNMTAYIPEEISQTFTDATLLKEIQDNGYNEAVYNLLRGSDTFTYRDDFKAIEYAVGDKTQKQRTRIAEEFTKLADHLLERDFPRLGWHGQQIEQQVQQPLENTVRIKR